MNLERVAELLGEAIVPEPPGAEIARLKEIQRKHANWGDIAGLVTGGLILVLFMILVFSQMIMRGGILILPGTLLILLAIGAGVMVYFQASAKSLKEKLEKPTLPSADAALPLDSPTLSSPGSIADRTTELLPSNQGGSTREIAN